jgi:hypothetical protein
MSDDGKKFDVEAFFREAVRAQMKKTKTIPPRARPAHDANCNGQHGHGEWSVDDRFCDCGANPNPLDLEPDAERRREVNLASVLELVERTLGGKKDAEKVRSESGTSGGCVLDHVEPRFRDGDSSTWNVKT